MVTTMIGQNSVPVRLSDREKETIRRAVDNACKKYKKEWTLISVFGSRADTKALGGDIDLYVYIERASDEELSKIKRSLTLELEDGLGEQKLDLVLDSENMKWGAFKEVIMKTKVDLWTKQF